MATASIVVPKFDPKSGRPKMIIQGANGDPFILPWAPRQIDHSNIGEEVIEIERPGRVVDIAVKAPKLPKMGLTFIIGKNINQSCEEDIRRLRAIVEAGGWLMILYGPQESGLWKCTDFSWSSVEREPLGNHVSRATVTMSLSRVPDSRQTVAQYSIDFNFRDDVSTAGITNQIAQLASSIRGSNQTSNGSSTGGSGGTVTPAGNVDYVVKDGDTLLTIAQHFYGQYGEQFWRLIGDTNVIDRAKPLVGQILRIP